MWVPLVGALALIALIAGWIIAGPEPEPDGGSDGASAVIPAGLIGEDLTEATGKLEQAGFTTEPRSFEYRDCEVPSGTVRQVLVESNVVPGADSRRFENQGESLYEDNEYAVVAGIPDQDDRLVRAEIPSNTKLYIWISNGLNKQGTPCT
jgi:hypothetical protein